MRENRRKNIEYYKEYDRKRANLPHRVEARKAYSQTEAGKAAHKRAHEKQKRKYPVKRGARMLVNNGLKNGRIVRPDDCSKCGANGPLHAHHDDYAKPLDVRWLCIPCHTKWHRKHGEAKNAE